MQEEKVTACKTDAYPKQISLGQWLDLKFEGDFVQTLLPAHCCTLYNLDKGFLNCETFKSKPALYKRTCHLTTSDDSSAVSPASPA